MSETAERVKSLFKSPKSYHSAARPTLPILVRQAKASESIQYGALATEVGVSSPRNMGYPLGSIGQTLLELGRRWRQTIPPIQAIVMTKAGGIGGRSRCGDALPNCTAVLSIRRSRVGSRRSVAES